MAARERFVELLAARSVSSAIQTPAAKQAHLALLERDAVYLPLSSAEEQLRGKLAMDGLVEANRIISREYRQIEAAESSPHTKTDPYLEKHKQAVIFQAARQRMAIDINQLYAPELAAKLLKEIVNIPNARGPPPLRPMQPYADPLIVELQLCSSHLSHLIAKEGTEGTLKSLGIDVDTMRKYGYTDSEISEFAYETIDSLSKDYSQFLPLKQEMDIIMDVGKNESLFNLQNDQIILKLLEHRFSEQPQKDVTEIIHNHLQMEMERKTTISRLSDSIERLAGHVERERRKAEEEDREGQKERDIFKPRR
jgi:hypothetical protein